MGSPEQHEVAVSAVKDMAHSVREHLDKLRAASYTSREDGVDKSLLISIEDSLMNSLALVRNIQNRAAPVNSLPPEVLAQIFEWAHNLSWTRFPDSNPDQRVVLSHVCSYWRKTALADSLLWNSVVFSPTTIANMDSFAHACLDRVGDAPLDLRIDFDQETVPEAFWEELGARCHQLRSFDILAFVGDVGREIFLHLTDPAPLLENLSIRPLSWILRTLYSDNTNIAVMDRVELPLLFDGHTPSLLTLHIEHFSRFSRNNFAGPRLLHVRFDELEFRSMDDVYNLLRLLRASPNLQDLAMHGTYLLSEQPSSTASSEEFIPMLSLRELSFERCHATVIATILARLELPRQNVTVTCKDWHPAERHISTIFPDRMRSRIYPLQDVRKLDLMYDTSEIRAVGPWSATHIKLQQPRDDWAMVDTIAPGLRLVLSFHALEELWLSGREGHSWQFWQETFGSMPLLRRLFLRLDVDDPDADKWLRALGGEDLLNGKLYPAPGLRELYILRPVKQANQTLVDMLEVRDKHKHRIPKLYVMCSPEVQYGHNTAVDTSMHAFRSWRAQADILERFVDTVKFEAVREYPTIDIPESCRSFNDLQ